MSGFPENCEIYEITDNQAWCFITMLLCAIRRPEIWSLTDIVNHWSNKLFFSHLITIDLTYILIHNCIETLEKNNYKIESMKKRIIDSQLTLT